MPVRLVIHGTSPRMTVFGGNLPYAIPLASERVCHQTWKLSPHPHRPFSFGLVNVNPEVSAFTS